MTPILKIMTVAVKKTADTIIRDFNELEKILDNTESAEKFALSAHEKVTDIIYRDLSKIKANYSFNINGHELKSKDDSNCFYINGICALDNFAKSLTNFSIDIFLLRDNKVFASVVYNPVLHDIFYAEVGYGAFWNFKKLRYKPSSNLYATNSASIKSALLDNKNINITNSYSLDLCNLSANKYCGLIYDTISISEKNINAGLCIAQEAGVKFEKQLSNENVVKLITI